MFEFLDMIDNYEDRKVDRYEEGNLTISTARVNDSVHSFETAVKHPKYNGGDWIIVENYDILLAAMDGHNRWVKKMTAKRLPKTLVDVCKADVADFRDSLSGDAWREFEQED